MLQLLSGKHHSYEKLCTTLCYASKPSKTPACAHALIKSLNRRENETSSDISGHCFSLIP